MFCLLLLIALNTLSGVKLARRKGKFDIHLLKKSIVDKMTGYFMMLSALSIFIVVLYVASMKDGQKWFDDFWFNAPVMACLVFLSSVEFKSILENLESLGVYIPLFVKRLPDQVQNKINNENDKIT
jgi:phage-related holin